MNKEEELLRKKSPVSIRNKKASFEKLFQITARPIAFTKRDGLA